MVKMSAVAGSSKPIFRHEEEATLEYVTNVAKKGKRIVLLRAMSKSGIIPGVQTIA